MVRRRHLAFLAALATLLTGATSASAATTVSRVGTAFTVTGDDAANRIVGGDYTDAKFQDENGGAVAAAGECAQISASIVDCGVYPPGATVTVSLGGGDDYYKRATISYPQTVDGGEGNDSIETGEGNDTVRGGPGNDDLNGARGDDTMDGGDGDDKVDGWDGSDTITGGPGRDNLLGDGSTLYSGGNDVVFARDGEADAVDCGGGADRAQIDASDVVAGCAAVDRPAATGGAGGAGTTGGTGSTPPQLGVAGNLTTNRKLGQLAAGKKLGVTLTANAACTAQVAIAITKSEAKRLKLGTKALSLGESATTDLQADTPATVNVAIASKYRAKLRRASKLSATLLLVCADASARTYTGGLKVSLKR